MLKALYYFLQYRIDFALVALAVAAACVWIRRVVRRRGTHCRMPNRAFLLAAGIVLTGGVLAEFAAQDRVRNLERLFAGFGPTYASELAERGHALIGLDTPADDPRYLGMIEAEKRWLSLNPVIADVYTFRRDAAGHLRLIVDSETDYDHNGRYDAEREQRTPIGEVYDEDNPLMLRALAGETVFDSSFSPDRWGISVSSYAPIHDRDGRVEAAVGIDYPAAGWLEEIGRIRAVCLGAALVLVIILLTSSTLASFLSAEIAERARTQRRLEEASESAFAASSAKSEFLAIMGHEVRTPLSAIMGFASILADTRLDPTQHRYVATMQKAGESLVELLNGILDFTRLESGKVELERLPWSPAMLIHEVMQTMSARAEERGIALQFDNCLPGNLTLEGDVTRVRQILLNLAGNALKFTNVGSVTVRATWSPGAGEPPGGRLAVAVIDTGIGIAADKIPHLFKPFAQADASTTRTHGGSGLGLAICRRLTEMMSGSLTVESTPGQGTHFSLTLAARLASGPAPVSGDIAAATALPALRALVVDDQRLNRELLKVMLRRFSIDADLAASGPEAVRLACAHSYSVILSDLEMPEMDGFSTAQRIRAAEAPGRRVPMIAISALATKGTRERCIAAGMDDYITKPIYLPALQSALAALQPRMAPSIGATAETVAAGAELVSAGGGR